MKRTEWDDAFDGSDAVAGGEDSLEWLVFRATIEAVVILLAATLAFL